MTRGWTYIKLKDCIEECEEEFNSIVKDAKIKAKKNNKKYAFAEHVYVKGSYNTSAATLLWGVVRQRNVLPASIEPISCA